MRPLKSTLYLGEKMFSQLKNVVDLIRSSFGEISKLRSNRERKEIILQILKIYFLLKDCVDDGEILIKAADYNPVGKIKSMDGDEAIAALTAWDTILRKQGLRLYILQDCIFGEAHLSIINPELQNRISEIIGYKMDRAVTLHGIGATLSLRNMFPIKSTDEEKARLVTLMAGARDDGPLNTEEINSELAALRSALDEYRNVVERFVSDEELLTLSRRAREQILIV